jgi:hypothetical protein
MQKISVDLIRLAVSGAVICAVVGVAELGGLRHSDQLAAAKTRMAPPIRVNSISVGHVNAISVGAPALCWSIDEPIGASATQGAQAERRAFAQTCSSVAPILRRLSEPPSRLALAP